MMEMLRLPGHIAVHVSRERRRIIEIDDIYFLEADGPHTLVRTRSRQRIRDTRSLGEILEWLGPETFFLRASGIKSLTANGLQCHSHPIATK